MDGLATYELLKTGFGIFIMILLLCGAIWMTIYSRKKHYKATSECNIINNNDASKTQTVTYSVDGKKYVKTVPSITVTQNNTPQYTWSEGACKLYYASADPNDYSINSNPATIFEIVAIVLFLISIGTIIWFLFLKSHKEVAGVVGGIDAAQSVFSIFNRHK